MNYGTPIRAEVLLPWCKLNRDHSTQKHRTIANPFQPFIMPQFRCEEPSVRRKCEITCTYATPPETFAAILDLPELFARSSGWVWILLPGAASCTPLVSVELFQFVRFFSPSTGSGSRQTCYHFLHATQWDSSGNAESIPTCALVGVDQGFSNGGPRTPRGRNEFSRGS